MRDTRIILCAALITMVTLSACKPHKEACLPQGERAIVLRKGSDGGQRYVTLKRKNGEEVTCIGSTTPVLLSEGDEIDGWTMTKADATKAP